MRTDAPQTFRPLWLKILSLSRRIASLESGSSGTAITALTGDVTASGPGSAAATIANDAVTYAKIQNVSAASRLLGRGSAAGAGDVEEITLGTGLSMSGTTLNGTSAVSDGDKGDITVSSSGTVWTIDNDVVTPAKMDDGAALSVLGRSANSSGDRADIAAASDHQVFRRSGTSVGFGAVNLASANAVTGDLPMTNVGARRTSVSISFDNNGVELPDNTKARWRVPNGVTATIVRWSIAADVSGAIVINIWKDTWANYPPSSGDSIIGSGTAPTITASDDNAESTSFTGYTTTTFSGGDSVIFNIDSCTTITACDLELEFDVIE